MAVKIYAIRCDAYDMTYVGSTKGTLAKRFREHRCLLRSGKHKCEELQEDWKLCEEFEFSIRLLEELPEDGSLWLRRALEVNWMRHFGSKLYNTHILSMRPTDEAIRKGVANAHKLPGKRWTPEANEKRRQAQLGIPKGHGAKISATKRAKREQRDEIV